MPEPVRPLLLLALFLAACRAGTPGSDGDTPAPDTAATVPAPGGATPDEPPAPVSGDTLQPDEAGAGDEAPAEAREAFEGTVGTTAKPSARGGVALLQAVRIGRHAGFDRVVFAFAGDALPGYDLEYVDRPVRNCGEGRVVPIQGDAWLRIRLTPANAHTDAGQPTVAPRERLPGLPVIREAELTCDYEADVTWVLGLSTPNPYRVLELRDPARLVVDVRH